LQLFEIKKETDMEDHKKENNTNNQASTEVAKESIYESPKLHSRSRASNKFSNLLSRAGVTIQR